ncbi:MAG: hypothetical protein KAJ42_18270 [Gemmatimonadetes bacterium]|nr:hypothetical protein [Gemmatimonadota bacterium]
MATRRRRNGLALRRNGALNHMIAKKIKVNIRTARGREAVKQFKRTPAYKKWAASAATKRALSSARTAAKKRTAASKAYTKRHGTSRAAEYMASRGGTTRKRKSSTKKGQVRKTARRAYETKSGGKLTSWQKHVQKTVKAGGSFADASATYKKSTRKTRKTSTRKGQVRKTARRAYETKGGKSLWHKHVTKTLRAGGSMADASATYKKKANSSRRRRNPSRRRNSSYGALALRTNPMATGLHPVDFVAGAVDKVPVVGPRVAPYVAPLAVGAISMGGLGYLHQFMEEKDWVPEWSQPYSYSLIGVGGAMATLAVPVGSLNARRMIAAAMATLGAGIDVYRRYFAGAPSMAALDAAANGDLGALAYKANRGYGALAYKANRGYGAYEYTGGALNNPTFRGHALHSHTPNPGYGDASEATGTYMDASQHDAQYAPGDFDVQEAQVLMMGPRAFFQTFGKPAHKLAHRQKGGASRHAGQPGHKWGWMVKLIGFKGMQQLASMPPAQRRQFIAQLKSQAQQSLLAHSGNILPDQPHVFQESGPTGAHGYGAFVYKGGAL